MKIDFEVETPRGVYRDAIIIEDGAQYSDEQLEALKNERVQAWLHMIDNPPAPSEPEFIEVDGVRYVRVNDNG